MLDRGWRPILSGEAAGQARAAVDAIAHQLERALSSAVARGRSDRDRSKLALLFAYLGADAAGDPARAGRWAEVALSLMEAEVERLDPASAGMALYGGLPGVAWSIMHLEHVLEQSDAAGDDGDGADPCEDVDPVILAAARGWSDAASYDLIHGVSGVGIYGLARLASPLGAAIAEAAIQHLARRAERRADGVTWRTSPAELDRVFRGGTDDVSHNVGAAHGVPGVIGFLGHAVGAGIAVDTARPLLEGAVRWTLAQRLTDGVGDRFPGWVGDGGAHVTARLAWCYGGLGVAAALMVAARCAGEPTWAAHAVDIARDAADCPDEQSLVMDACLCHGAAGNAHLFNRLYQTSGDARLGDAARHWYERALAMRGPDGYQFWSLEPASDGTKPTWNGDRGFLSGAAGVAIALLAAISPVEPAWDRLLVADAPR